MENFLRLLIAAVLGGLVGIERQMGGRQPASELGSSSASALAYSLLRLFMFIKSTVRIPIRQGLQPRLWWVSVF